MKHEKLPFMLVIYGPTGVGKTDFSLAIAEHLPAEIINMDVGQFYTPLSIGTAKPDWQNSPIPHHFFDIINKPENFSVSEYRKILYEKVNEITARNKIPILVGGSGFYLHALLYNLPLPQFSSSPSGDQKFSSSSFLRWDPQFRPHVPLSLHMGTPQLRNEIGDKWQELYSIDPKRAMAIDQTDTYRIERALDIWYQTGTLPSSYKPVYSPQADYLILFIERDRQEVKERINARVMEMVNSGWIEEAQALMGTKWQPFLEKKNLIGYPEIFRYLSGGGKKEEFLRMIEIIQAKTRQYAKRQFTFWRKLEREIKKENQYTNMSIGCVESINASDPKNMTYTNELIRRLLLRWKQYE